MIAVMKRAGMVDDGRRIRQCVFEGEEVDIVHMALFQEDWKELSAKRYVKNSV
jgi:RimJ/RimL family protein N-acetyltransferase